MKPADARTVAPQPNPADAVFGIALGYLLSRCLHVVTELGVADLLRDGPRSARDLGVATGARPELLARLLRALATQGVFTEEADGRFAQTPSSALLQRGILRDGVLLCGEVAGDGSWWNAAGLLKDTVITGEPAFERRNGVGFFDYVRAKPDCAAWFDRGMASFASAENPAIAAAYDFSGVAHVVDVGGGQGGQLAEILKLHAGVRATLFDLAHVVAKPADLSSPAFAGRWDAVAGDFFAAVPANADAYVLKRILHDWSDEECVRILQACRKAMKPAARLLVIDAVVPPGNVFHPAKVMDVLMMIFGHGRERSEHDFRVLLKRADLRLARVIPTASTLSIVEAMAA